MNTSKDNNNEKQYAPLHQRSRTRMRRDLCLDWLRAPIRGNAPVNAQAQIDHILASRDTSAWLRQALSSALDRAHLDAYADAKLLLEVISRVSQRTAPTLGDS